MNTSRGWPATCREDSPAKRGASAPSGPAKSRYKRLLPVRTYSSAGQEPASQWPGRKDHRKGGCFKEKSVRDGPRRKLMNTIGLGLVLWPFQDLPKRFHGAFCQGSLGAFVDLLHRRRTIGAPTPLPLTPPPRPCPDSSIVRAASAYRRATRHRGAAERASGPCTCRPG